MFLSMRKAASFENGQDRPCRVHFQLSCHLRRFAIIYLNQLVQLRMVAQKIHAEETLTACGQSNSIVYESQGLG